MSVSLLKVALIGRPNVGKSTLFNRFTGERKAIVHDFPGVTRDRQYGSSDWNGVQFELIDTGGLEPKTENEILRAMRRQTDLAILEADIVLLMVDVRDGLLPQDGEILDELRRSLVPTMVVVNKADNSKLEHLASDFYGLGVDKIHPISASHGLGVGDLLDDLVELLIELHEERDLEFGIDEQDVVHIPRISVIGKPNAGKSTLINRILGEERLLAMPIAGTTRDAIDVELTYKDKPYLFIDTAGIRRQKYVKEKLEKVSIYQSLDSLDRCDLALFMIDATEGVTEQDTKVAGFAHNKGRGVIILVNKWDVMSKSPEATKKFEAEIRRRMKYLKYAPILFCSALTGLRIPKIFEQIDQLMIAYQNRVPTGQLNRFFEEMMRYHPPPLHRGRPIKFYFITQARIRPPTFMISANQPQAAHVTYKRFIMNSLRENFNFKGVPIKLFFRARKQKTR